MDGDPSLAARQKSLRRTTLFAAVIFTIFIAWFPMVGVGQLTTTTEVRGAARYEIRHGLPLAGKSLQTMLPAASVQTFEVENVIELVQ